MNIGLSFERKKEEKTPLEGKMSEFGLHVWTDRHLNDRLENNRATLGKMWTDDEIAALGISKAKMTIMKRANRMLEYLGENVPWGNLPEDPRLMDAVNSIVELIERSQILSLSDTRDEDCILLSNDYFTQVNKVVWRTFNKENTSVNKSFVVQAMPSNAAGSGAGMDPDLKAALQARYDELQKKEE